MDSSGGLEDVKGQMLIFVRGLFVFSFTFTLDFYSF